VERGSERVIENDVLHVEADESDGTLTVLDKRTGREMRGLHRIVDGGDRGDEYNFCAPENDRLVDKPASAPRIRVETAKGMRSLIVESTYRLPSGLSADRSARSEAECDERIVSTITLTDGVPRVDISTTVFNAAEDHRLRVHFPSEVKTDRSKADQHFGVVERPIALPEWDRETWMEQPLGTYPQKAFVSVDDGVNGLTVANRGLPEYEVLDAKEGAEIAVTLMRCVGWLSRSDIYTRRGGAGPQLRTPGAQMHGRHVFEYSIIPHAEDWEAGKAHVQAIQALRPMRARWNRHGLGHLGDASSLVQVSGDSFQVSAIKRAEDGDGVIVRVYDTTSHEAETFVDVAHAEGDVSMVNLNEEHIADVPRVHGGAAIAARANEIVTLRFRR
jgi:alpha-mannosidase